MSDRVTVGLDEVGRGAWAGPLVVCAVGFGGVVPAGLNDSKLLTKKRRELLAKKIKNTADFIGFGWAEASEIDRLGLSAANKLAYLRSVAKLEDYSELIIDGSINYLREMVRSKCIISADQIIPSVSAASILAKVARDQFMMDLDRAIPGYGFESHVGYGTKLHICMLKKLGVSSQHRISYKPVGAVT